MTMDTVLWFLIIIGPISGLALVAWFFLDHYGIFLLPWHHKKTVTVKMERVDEDAEDCETIPKDDHYKVKFMCGNCLHKQYEFIKRGKKADNYTKIVGECEKCGCDDWVSMGGC